MNEEYCEILTSDLLKMQHMCNEALRENAAWRALAEWESEGNGSVLFDDTDKEGKYCIATLQSEWLTRDTPQECAIALAEALGLFKESEETMPKTSNPLTAVAESPDTNWDAGFNDGWEAVEGYAHHCTAHAGVAAEDLDRREVAFICGFISSLPDAVLIDELQTRLQMSENGKRVEVFEGVRHADCSSYLEDFFDQDQLSDIESAFEGCLPCEGEHFFEVDGTGEEDESPRLLEPADRMRLIMENIIANGGTFDTSKRPVSRVVYTTPGFKG